MAQTYGYTSPWYFYWANYSGGKHIRNELQNHVMKKYKDGWDYPRVYQPDGNYYNVYPTVSGDGAKLNGGNGNDSIENCGNNVVINGGGGKDIINNSGKNVSILGGADNDSIYNGFSYSDGYYHLQRRGDYSTSTQAPAKITFATPATACR